MAEKILDREFFRECGKRGAQVRKSNLTEKDRDKMRITLAKNRKKLKKPTGFLMFNKLASLAKGGKCVVVRLIDGTCLRGKLLFRHPRQCFWLPKRDFYAREVAGVVEVKR